MALAAPAASAKPAGGASADPGSPSGAPAEPSSRIAGTAAAPPDVAAPPAGARVTPSGVASRILRRGGGVARPKDNDRVKLLFTAWTRDGRPLATARAGADPDEQTVRNLLPGLIDTVKAMAVGEERRVWVPGRLGFTPAQSGKLGSPPDLTLDLTLVALLAAPPTPRDLRRPPPSARHTSSGLAYQLLARGSGARHPTDGDRVTFLDSAWTSDGKLFESTAMAGHAASYALSELLAGLREGVQLMRVGDKMRFWVPPALGFGASPRPGRPTGLLTYDVDLVSID